jgi:hypothetical protein
MALVAGFRWENIVAVSEVLEDKIIDISKFFLHIHLNVVSIESAICPQITL